MILSLAVSFQLLVEDGKNDVVAEERCGGRCLFFDERGGNPEERGREEMGLLSK